MARNPRRARSRRRFSPASLHVLEPRSLLTLTIPTVVLQLPFNYTGGTNGVGFQPVTGGALPGMRVPDSMAFWNVDQFDGPVPAPASTVTTTMSYSYPDGHGGTVQYNWAQSTTGSPNGYTLINYDQDTTTTIQDSGTESDGTTYARSYAYASHLYRRDNGSGVKDGGSWSTTTDAFHEVKGGTTLNETVLSSHLDGFQEFDNNTNGQMTYDSQSGDASDDVQQVSIVGAPIVGPPSLAETGAMTVEKGSVTISAGGGLYQGNLANPINTGSSNYTLTTYQVASNRNENNGGPLAAEADSLDDENYTINATASSYSQPNNFTSSASEQDSVGDGSDSYATNVSQAYNKLSQSHSDQFSFNQSDRRQDANNLSGTFPHTTETLSVNASASGNGSNSRYAQGDVYNSEDNVPIKNTKAATSTSFYTENGTVTGTLSNIAGTASVQTVTQASYTDGGDSSHDLNLITEPGGTESDHSTDTYRDTQAMQSSSDFESTPTTSSQSISTQYHTSGSDGGIDTTNANLGDGAFDTLGSSYTNQYGDTYTGNASGATSSSGGYGGYGSMGGTYIPSLLPQFAPVQTTDDEYTSANTTSDAFNLNLANAAGDRFTASANDTDALTASGNTNNPYGMMYGGSGPAAMTRHITGSSSLYVALPSTSGLLAQASDNYSDAITDNNGSVTRIFSDSPQRTQSGGGMGMFSLPNPTTASVAAIPGTNAAGSRAGSLMTHAEGLNVENFLGLLQTTEVFDDTLGTFYEPGQLQTSGGSVPASLPSTFAPLPAVPTAPPEIQSVQFATPAAASQGSTAVTVTFTDGNVRTVSPFQPFGGSGYNQELDTQIGPEDYFLEPKANALVPYEFSQHPRVTSSLFATMPGYPWYYSSVVLTGP